MQRVFFRSSFADWLESWSLIREDVIKFETQSKHLISTCVWLNEEKIEQQNPRVERKISDIGSFETVQRGRRNTSIKRVLCSYYINYNANINKIHLASLAVDFLAWISCTPTDANSCLLPIKRNVLGCSFFFFSIEICWNHKFLKLDKWNQ